MSRTIAELRSTPDDELIAQHDALARNTVVGVNYYLDEIRRREAAEQGDRMESLTRQVKNLTWAVVAMTAIITLATIINLLVFISSV